MKLPSSSLLNGRLPGQQPHNVLNSETLQKFQTIGKIIGQTQQATPSAAPSEQDRFQATPLEAARSQTHLELFPQADPALEVSSARRKTTAGTSTASPLAASENALQSGRRPGQPGPFEVTKLEMKLGGNDVDVYLPVGKGPFPLNIYSPGLSHGQRNATANANHFASWGMVTIVPSLGGNLNPINSGRVVEKIVSELSQRNQIQGVQVQPEQIAVSGHSFGGLTASLAADHPSVKALLALDPNDNLFQLNPGSKNAANVTVPAAFIFGDGGPNDLGPAIYEGMSSSSKFAIRLKNMPHLNFTSSSQWPDQRGQQQALDYATAFLLSELAGLKGTAPYLPKGAAMESALKSGKISKL